MLANHVFISIGDVAAIAVSAIGHPEARNKLLPLGGPEALSRRDVIRTYEFVLGRSISAEFLPPPAAPSRISMT